MKLFTCISRNNGDEDSFEVESTPSPLTVTSQDLTPKMNFNNSVEINDGVTSNADCCCAMLTEEQINIRQEIADFKAEIRDKNEDRQQSHLKAELQVKNNRTKHLEEELDSYKLALELLMKEFGKAYNPDVNCNEESDQYIEQTVRTSDSGGGQEVSFVTVKRKKAKSKPKPKTQPTRNVNSASSKNQPEIPSSLRQVMEERML